MKKYCFPARILFLTLVIFGTCVSLTAAQQPVVSTKAPSLGASLDRALAMDTIMDSAVMKRKVLGTVFIVLLGYFLMFGFIRVINKRVKDIKTRYAVRKNTVYVVSLVLLLVLFVIWIQSINSLTILLGVASAGLALALQEVILSIAGWFLIILRHPFEAGDRIEINGIRGDVIDIRIFQTSVLEIGNWVHADQSTGRIVHFPNSFVFKHATYNYNREFEFIWNEIPILLTFESDWKRGREIMMAHAKNLAEGLEAEVSRKIEAMRNRYMIYYGKLTPIVYVDIKDSGVELTLRYLTEAKKRRSTQDQLCQAILEDFRKEPNVKLAYPTYRIVKT
ncbi:MAG: mechanosensitive ion channel [Candidatus Omnitrophica bacterium]|nr:mechanosensitive ion channel [Candidatus Omnitrophota bacterium]